MVFSKYNQPSLLRDKSKLHSIDATKVIKISETSTSLIRFRARPYTEFGLNKSRITAWPPVAVTPISSSCCCSVYLIVVRTFYLTTLMSRLLGLRKLHFRPYTLSIYFLAVCSVITSSKTLMLLVIALGLRFIPDK